jgi:RHS repeat-associated protein
LTSPVGYNGDGARTSRTTGGDTTQYVLGLAATLPVVISDTEPVYLHGLDIIAQQQAERLYYLHDGLGSVRQLVDSTGHIETNYAYDPFGVPLVGGEVYNPYQFTGQAWDAEVQLLYLRARYYQPQVGRFVTKDPWVGHVRRPGTLNGYVYVADNPINLSDRSGLQGCGPGFICPPFDPDLVRDAELLEQDYGVFLGREYLVLGEGGFQYAFWSDWTADQLDLVLEAVGDFAFDMDRREAAFRAKMGPVRLYKRPGELTAHLRLQAGLTTPWSITLSGWYWDNKEAMKWVIVHEFAHWWDGREGAQLSGQMWAGRFWEVVSCDVPLAAAVRLKVREWREDRPTELLNPREDWAESVAAYIYPDYAGGPGRLKEISRARWDYVARYMNPGSPKPYPEKWDDYEFKSVQL